MQRNIRNQPPVQEQFEVDVEFGNNDYFGNNLLWKYYVDHPYSEDGNQEEVQIDLRTSSNQQAPAKKYYPTNTNNGPSKNLNPKKGGYEDIQMNLNDGNTQDWDMEMDPVQLYTKSQGGVNPNSRYIREERQIQQEPQIYFNNPALNDNGNVRYRNEIPKDKIPANKSQFNEGENRKKKAGHRSANLDFEFDERTSTVRIPKEQKINPPEEGDIIDLNDAYMLQMAKEECEEIMEEDQAKLNLENKEKKDLPWNTIANKKSKYEDTDDTGVFFGLCLGSRKKKEEPKPTKKSNGKNKKSKPEKKKQMDIEFEVQDDDVDVEISQAPNTRKKK